MYEEPKMEKVTINLPPIEIARMDILIEAGYYPNRTELIRTAIRKTLDTHQEFIAKQIDNFVSSPEREIIDEKISIKRVYAMGVSIMGKSTFENAIAEGKRLKIRIVGLLNIREDVSPEHIEKAVESVKVYGILRASPKVRKALLRKGGEGEQVLWNVNKTDELNAILKGEQIEQGLSLPVARDGAFVQ